MNLTKFRPKMSVLFETESPQYTLAKIKATVHKWKCDCYLLKKAAFFKPTFEFSEVNILDRARFITTQYKETGLKSIWREIGRYFGGLLLAESLTRLKSRNWICYRLKICWHFLSFLLSFWDVAY